MNAVVEYRSREAVIHPYVSYEDCGDTVEDILKRLSSIETDVSKLKVDVGIIASNYATKTDVAEVKTLIANVRTELKSGIDSLETKMIKWFVATSLTVGSLAFTAAKYLH